MNLASIIRNGLPGMKIWLIAFVMGLLVLPSALNAQEDSAAVTTETEAEGPELIAPALDFITIQKPEGIDLKASLRAKVDGNFIRLHLLKVTFYQVTDSADKELGYVITDRAGVAVFHYKDEAITPSADGKINLKAVFAGNKAMESAEGEVSIKRAKIELTPVKEDSILSVQVKLINVANPSDSTLVEVPLSLYVKRTFNPLKIGEGTTDESGLASIEVPADLPGDNTGNITLIGRLDESEDYGIVESSVIQKWGIPVSDADQKQPRALWSSAPPTWMLITFIVLMTTVWGHYIVIIYELFRLRKEEPKVRD